jgi:ankyrin repeat protein
VWRWPRTQVLVEAGAQLAAENSAGLSALHAAAMSGQVRATRDLVNHGCAVDAPAWACGGAGEGGGGTDTGGGWGPDGTGVEPGTTPLYLAARQGHIEVIKTLVDELGADPNVATVGGRTAMHAAAGANQADAIRLLLLAGGRAVAPDHTGEVRSSAPLPPAQQLAASSSSKSVALLLVLLVGRRFAALTLACGRGAQLHSHRRMLNQGSTLQTDTRLPLPSTPRTAPSPMRLLFGGASHCRALDG